MDLVAAYLPTSLSHRRIGEFDGYLGEEGGINSSPYGFGEDFLYFVEV